MSAKLKEILPGAAIAATCWGDVEIRVYLQDVDNAIREFRYKDGWSGGSTYDVVLQAQKSSPLAIVQWMSGEQSEIRVYSLARGGGIQEGCWGGSAWCTGALNAQNIIPAPNSKLAASTGSCGIFVYYQADDNKIHEHTISGQPGWHAGQHLPTDLYPPLRGTSIASTYWGSISKRIFYQERGGTIREFKDDGSGWSVGSAVCEAKPNTPLAVIQWMENSKREIRLYSIDDNYNLQEYGHSGSTWCRGHRFEFVAPCSKLAAIHWDSNVRVYYQLESCGGICEHGCVWSLGWIPGVELRTPHSGSQAVDSNGATYPVNYLPYIMDITSWRSYDPSTVDGAEILVGYIDGHIIGERLSTQKITTLLPNTGGSSYLWVYAPGSAIIYRHHNHDDRMHYHRGARLSSGESVICAGEFTIGQNNRLESVTAMVSDLHSSGDHRPKGNAYLAHVARKFENLGISTDETIWYCD